MKKSFAVAGFAALMAACAFSGAKADDRWPMWYVGVTGGYTYMPDEDVSSASATKLDMNSGWGLGGSIGYLPSSSIPLINALRFEAEVTYHQNNVSTANRLGGGQITGNNATYSSTAYMVNTFYDFQTNSKWSPYIGGGLGMASLNLPTKSNAGNSNTSDSEFAYQLLAGIGYTPDSIPNTQWTLGYRYLATSDADLGGASVKYSTDSVEVGAKYRF